MNDEEPMRQPSDTHSDEPTFDDLLWELDVTTARPERQESAAAAGPVPAATPAPTPAPAPKPKAARTPKRGRFHRPELESRWERLSRNRVVQAIGGTVLLVGTAALVVVALGR